MLQRIRDGLSRHKWLQYTLLGALALVSLATLPWAIAAALRQAGE